MNAAHVNLTLRRASERDSESLLDWRNDPTTRAFSVTSDDVTSEQHNVWLNKTLQDSGCLLLIGEIDCKPVGMVRINILDDLSLGQVSINLNPEFRGRGISIPLLRESLEFGAQTLHNITQFLAEIHVDNSASKKIFESVGFVKVTESQRENFETYLLDSDLLVISQ
jgi:RimJ/RimL family protein N-acetyltransferase